MNQHIVLRFLGKFENAMILGDNFQLLTKTEYIFYKILRKECDQRRYLICPKVRMEDFLDVTNTEEKYKYRGYIKSRHIDFVICDDNLRMLCGVELDDYTHDREKSKKADAFKDQVFEKIKTRKKYAKHS